MESDVDYLVNLLQWLEVSTLTLVVTVRIPWLSAFAPPVNRMSSLPPLCDSLFEVRWP